MSDTRQIAVDRSPVAVAAQRLAESKGIPSVTTIRQEFGLTASQALDAIRESLLIKARSH